MSSKSNSELVTILASDLSGQLPSALRAGGIKSIKPHDKAAVVVRTIYGVQSGEVTVKNGRNKRETVPISTIHSLGVTPEAAKRIRTG